MDILGQQCAAQSTGTSNNLFQILLQTILAAQCGVSPMEKWPKDYGPTVWEKGLPLYDFIVVGGGTAGSVVANRLSENSDWNVLLIEAGGDPPNESEIPAIFLGTLNTTNTWNYYIELSQKTSKSYKRGLYWPRGKMLGGCSGVNAMLYVRGNRKDYDQWSDMGNPGWGFDDVLHYFKKSEGNKEYHKLDLDCKYHSSQGPLSVDAYHNEETLTQVILDAVSELGYKKLNDLNADEYIGFGLAQGTLLNGERCSAAKAFLNPIQERPNLHIIKNAQVTKLLIDDEKNVRGVNFILKGHEIQAFVRKEVILSAGPIESPHILMNSGIGPEIELKNFGIPVIQNLPVGENLQDHLTVTLLLKFNKSLAQSQTPLELAKDSFEYLTSRKGKLSGIGVANLMGFINTKDFNNPYPDIELMFFSQKKGSLNFKQVFSVFDIRDDIMEQLYQTNLETDTLQIFSILLNPKSKGKIRLKSANPLDYPIIDANYLDDQEDLETLKRSLQQIRQLLKTYSFRSHEIEEVQLNFGECEFLPYDSEEYWDCYIRYQTSTLYHPVGTVKMGSKCDSTTVLNPRLKVHGVTGLRVIDSSIMPLITSSNTYAPTVMIAEKGSDMIKADWTTQFYFQPQSQPIYTYF